MAGQFPGTDTLCTSWLGHLSGIGKTMNPRNTLIVWYTNGNKGYLVLSGKVYLFSRSLPVRSLMANFRSMALIGR
jgi:hypothetical protein